VLVEAMGPDDADRIEAIMQPAIALDKPPRRGRGSDDAAGELAPNYCFGQPRMPSDVPWPEQDGIPVPFMAHIDLRTLPEAANWPNQPQEGTLLFFGSSYSEDFADDAAGAVMLATDNDLPLRPAPPDLRGPNLGGGPEPDWVPPRSQALSPLGIGWSTPFHDYQVEGLPFEIPEDLIERFPAASVEENAQSVVLQLLGIPDNVQGNPIPPDNEQGPWRLLAQFDDGVFVSYFTIGETDLAQQNFARVRFWAACD
jgi:hypothetical protein